MSRAYLLLDSCQIENLPVRLVDLAPGSIPHVLYRMTQYAELTICSPLLVCVEAHSPLAHTFEMHWQDNAGIWLESDVDEDLLIAHLRSLVHARVDGDVSVLFRYYDPRIARLWLQDLPAGVREKVMGPVSLIRLPGCEFRRNGPAQAGADYAHIPWLKLNVPQIEHLGQEGRGVILQRVLEHAEQYFPEYVHGLALAARKQWAIACCGHAERQGFGAVDEVMRWVSVYGHFGDTFPDGPAHTRYRQLLAARELSPKERLDKVLDEFKRQIACAEVAL
ncbi:MULTISPECIES: DUF4123 domain-containing protein [Pseudomonas]|uniref:DUF4123 domain-containing protein n=1 Tax=Pseudomonas lundensis TaxID=86185 RepID=A0A266NDQ3_9PSED|nr:MULTISPECIES: DUF4123 domain-containing protein [Pseudomonas]NMY37605.1 DUF4123 domain-containing protein [Pseudomonas sp. WS 5078]NMY60346.1 DUF4123 domain-containing protein [Pseudomonas sp. WS 5354]OZY60636.1 hypothetical protein CJF39_05475 [Pseudomonas lundensis]